MCLGGGGGGGSTKAPVAGGYGEVTTTNDGGASSKYSLYDNTGKDITDKYTIDNKKQVVTKGSKSASDAGTLGAASYLYTRDA